jgi:hypothetical protein
LPELKKTTYELPKPPQIEKKVSQEVLDMRERKAFSLATEYDLNTYWGRF